MELIRSRKQKERAKQSASVILNWSQPSLVLIGTKLLSMGWVWVLVRRDMPLLILYKAKLAAGVYGYNKGFALQYKDFIKIY